ncbi:hypothetical protein [Nocardioides dongkuii]|uniref:hypothetical protein n=1 Tax=Nocardioides dongkuii TaxID=2760089 RepID=UPI0015FB8273|nr:hypothetical protein [Nocardioides dongkuii]
MAAPREPVDGAWDDDEDSWDRGDEDAPPSWFPGQHLPEDARRMGLDHRVPDGALLDFAGKLDATKPLHRITAWVMLVVFAMPVVFYVLRLVRDLGP